MRRNTGSLKSSYEIWWLLGILQIIGSMIFPYAHWNVKTIKNCSNSRSSNYSANWSFSEGKYFLPRSMIRPWRLKYFQGLQVSKHINISSHYMSSNSYLLNCLVRPCLSWYALLRCIKRRRYIPKKNECRWEKSCITVYVSVVAIWFHLIAIPMSLLWFNPVRKTKPLNRCTICI